MNDLWEVPASLIGGPFAIAVWAAVILLCRWLVRIVDRGREAKENSCGV
jgi:hypothetical protein